MKIGIVTTWFERGAAYVSLQFKNSLEKAGHEVFIYARGDWHEGKGDTVGWDSVKVTRGKIAPSPLAGYVNMKDYQAWLSRTGVNLVVFNEQRWWPAIIETRRAGVLTVAYVDYYKEDSISLFRCYDALVCNTRRHYSAFEWHPQAFYVPWGTDTELFAPDGGIDLIAEDHVTFFHSAGFSPDRKGTDLLLRAWADVKSPAKLLIHTQVPLVEAYPDLTGLIQREVKAGRLEIVEKTVPAPGLYTRGDVYVYPSRLDGIGLTVAEALSSGLPAIVTDEPPMNEFIKPNCGLLVDIVRRTCRYDAYYWPQAQCSIASLTEQMETYAGARQKTLAAKRAARGHALGQLDWFKNSQQLAGKLAAVTRSNITVDICQQDYLRWCNKQNPWVSFCEKNHRLISTAYSYRGLLKSLLLHDV